MHEDRELLALVIMLALSVGASMVLHWFVVCRELYRNGAHFPTGFLFWRQWRELRAFKDALAADCRPLTLYYLGCILITFNLLLLVVVLYWALWSQTGPRR